jgi:hypothetical protein
MEAQHSSQEALLEATIGAFELVHKFQNDWEYTFFENILTFHLHTTKPVKVNQ